jgi:two-component system, LytTR family, sensor kinase
MKNRKWIVHVFWWTVHLVLHNLFIFYYLGSLSLQKVIVSNGIWYFTILCTFYYNLWYASPRFLLTRRYILYTLNVLAMLAFCGIYPLLNFLQGKFDWASLPEYLIRDLVMGFETGIGFIIIGSSIVSYNSWRRNERIKNQLIREKLQAELSYLRSQVNPEFLFYALEKIHGFALEKSDKAPQAILRLSEIMRYMLYESSNEKIYLEREIRYLDDFIALQKLFSDNRHAFRFDIEEGDFTGACIPPMLLSSLFYPEPAHIDSDVAIRMQASDRKLLFTISTHLKEAVPRNDLPSLQGLQRRLDLVYPSSHELIIDYRDTLYKAELKIPIS